ncbi:exocyst complex component exo84-like [Teratosphaeria destructans]|uniref:Exocyst complex component EXO84 n=1 Tax=Teratosphaeria destructans TaxID=418781 RepID=A0A9W7T0J8_9PEZI|nr:exocyst complex component exo84-like [Teratosphaeria destructans]
MSEEKSKGISLRRKKTTRPTISAPRQIPSSQQRDPSTDGRNPSILTTQTSNSNLSVPGQGRPSTSGSTADKTSDLVKRRYSTRFTGQAPNYNDGGLAPPVPSMPSLPAQYAQRGRKSQDSRSPSREGKSPSRAEGRIKADARALKDPNLQAEQYVQGILAEATEDDISAYQADLQKIKEHTNMDLQHSVYQNRTQFIKISKEADRLKSEMRALRTLMSDLTGSLSAATSAGGGAEMDGLNGHLSVADRKRANRSSVANLEAMWSTHLQTLWKRVEGSQKYLPALPGRHIIMESQRWVELNAATWKTRRRVALVLLNDHFLVASAKKRNDLLPGASGANGTSPNSKRQSMYQPSQTTTLVAERCWPLIDVSLADISRESTSSSYNPGSREHKAIANAVNVRAGNESFTYATSDPAEKAGIIVAFRKAQEDLRKQMAIEHGERERKLDEFALLTGKDPRALKKAAADEAERDKASGGLSRSNSVLIDVEGRQQSIRWVESQIDGLDIDIALQRFEEAVNRTEKLRKLARNIKGNEVAKEIILAKVDERASRLATSISRQLVQNSIWQERTKENVSWLLRLGYEDLARSKYLDARTETIRLRMRSLPFTGALPPYLHALSFITFTLLLHTFRTFSSSFPAASGSAVVRWAKERVDEFREGLERQLSSVERGTELWDECLLVVQGQAEVLKEVGVDFSNMIARGLEDGTPAPNGVVASGVARDGQAVGLGVSGA